jgi:ATP-dependent exoDNAse (exonuclease V) beta subunit
MAKKYAPTPEQRDVIDITDRTILLSAAAGSGKTATLTERLITMVTRKEDPLDVTRMLVVTFTRAAAEELRTRIAAALTEAVLAHPDDERLAKQLLLLPTARIRTIDAFCNDLVKGHTAALGISPLYRIADESEVDILGISLLDDLIEDAYDGTFAPEGLDIASVVEVAESVKSQGTLAEELYKLYKTSLHGQKDGVSLLSHHAEALSREANLPFFDSRAGKALKEHYLALFAHQKSLLEKTKQAIVDKEGEENVILKTLLPKYTYLCEFFDSLAAA